MSPYVSDALLAATATIIGPVLMSFLFHYKTWKVCVYGSVFVAVASNAILLYSDWKRSFGPLGRGDWAENGLLAELLDPLRWFICFIFVCFFVALYLLSKSGENN